MDSAYHSASPVIGAPLARDAWATYRRQADTYFRLALAVNAVLTLVWLAFGITGRDGGAVLGTVRFQADVLLRVTAGVLIMVVVWGLLWYALKRVLLRRWCGLSADELRRVFGSRMTHPFELQSLLAAHSERRLRIADMVGRRGRFFFLGLAAYIYVYSRVSAQPTPHFLFLGLQEGVLDAIALNWLMLACYYSDGFMGAPRTVRRRASSTGHSGGRTAS